MSDRDETCYYASSCGHEICNSYECGDYFDTTHEEPITECPKCGQKWDKDCDQFGCWACGFDKYTPPWNQ